jgi:hypothetical protein
MRLPGPHTPENRRKSKRVAKVGLAYNALVLSWPEIANIGQSTPETAQVQGELI